MSKHASITLQDFVHVVIDGLEENELMYFRTKYSSFVEGYRFMKEYKLGIWDGKKYLFDVRTGKTFFQFLPEIITHLYEKGYEIDITDNRPPAKELLLRVDENMFETITLRPYQVESANLLLENQSGFIVAGTGSGKTSITAALCEILNREGLRVIVFVPSSDLVTQTAEWLQHCGVDAGEYCGGKKDTSKMTTIATWQSIKNAPALMELFQAVVVDESHGAKAYTIQKLLNEYGTHIPYRFGFTGTFPLDRLDQMLLHSSLGSILKEIPASWLIANGYLAKIEIEPIQIELKRGKIQDFPDYDSERAYIDANETYHKILANIIVARCKEYGNTLVLVSSVDLGKALQKLIKDSVFMDGKTKKKTRLEQYAEFEEQDNLIKIVTFGIAAQGISINRIFHLFLIDAEKSFTRAIQSVGRGLRLGRDKSYIRVSDVNTNFKHGKKHYKDREKYYKNAEYPILPQLIVKV